MESPLTLVQPGHDEPVLLLFIFVPGTGTPAPNPCCVPGALLSVGNPHQDTTCLNAQVCQPQILHFGLWHFCQLPGIAGLPRWCLW